jgi:uncharacterized membrane protein
MPKYQSQLSTHHSLWTLIIHCQDPPFISFLWVITTRIYIIVLRMILSQGMQGQGYFRHVGMMLQSTLVDDTNQPVVSQQRLYQLLSK